MNHRLPHSLRPWLAAAAGFLVAAIATRFIAGAILGKSPGQNRRTCSTHQSRSPAPAAARATPHHRAPGPRPSGRRRPQRLERLVAHQSRRRRVLPNDSCLVRRSEIPRPRQGLLQRAVIGQCQSRPWPVAPGRVVTIRHQPAPQFVVVRCASVFKVLAAPGFADPSRSDGAQACFYFGKLGSGLPALPLKAEFPSSLTDFLFHILPTVQGGLALIDLSATFIKQALMLWRDCHFIQANPHFPPEFLHNLKFALDRQIFDFCNGHQTR